VSRSLGGILAAGSPTPPWPGVPALADLTIPDFNFVWSPELSGELPSPLQGERACSGHGPLMGGVLKFRSEENRR